MDPFLNKLLGTWERVESVETVEKLEYQGLNHPVELIFEHHKESFLVFRCTIFCGVTSQHRYDGFIRTNPENNKVFSNQACKLCRSFVVMEGNINGNKIMLESKHIEKVSKNPTKPRRTKMERIYELINDNELIIKTYIETTDSERTHRYTFKKRNN